jgi:hypothetical protein
MSVSPTTTRIRIGEMHRDERQLGWRLHQSPLGRALRNKIVEPQVRMPRSHLDLDLSARRVRAAATRQHQLHGLTSYGPAT